MPFGKSGCKITTLFRNGQVFKQKSWELTIEEVLGGQYVKKREIEETWHFLIRTYYYIRLILHCERVKKHPSPIG